MKAVYELHLERSPKYNRKEACVLINFSGNFIAFSQWLREHSFLGQADHPQQTLIDRGIMDVRSKQIYKDVEYDCCGQPVSGNEHETAAFIKSVFTPLFTEKGIIYFRELLQDDAKLKAEAEQIKNNETYYKIRAI